MYVLPSHSSHIIQPLDLVFYGCLKEEWKRASRDYRTISRHAAVTKQTFTVVFADAWQQSYSADKIRHAFESSGLCPWNPDRPDYSKCSPSAVWGKTAVASGSFIEGMGGPSTLAPCDLPLASPSSDQQDLDPLPFINQQDLDPLPSTNQQDLDPLPSTSQQDLDPLPSTSANYKINNQNRENIAFYTCQLIDHVLACGWSPVDMFNIRRRQFKNVPATSSEPDYARYLELWNKVVPQPTFDNLPLPVPSGRKSSRAPRVQPPSYVSHVSFKEFHENKEREEAAKKRAVEDRKAEMLRKREEKMKKKLEEKERKRLEREQKKAEKLEEKMKKAAMKGKGRGKRRRVEEDDEPDSSSDDNTQVVFDDRSDDEMDMNELCGVNDVDESVCATCGNDGDGDGWIGCECGRWYHRGCTGNDRDKILAMSEEETSEFHFVCAMCG